jgi:hypothetical protein
MLKMLKIEYEDRYRLINDKADPESSSYMPPCVDLPPPPWMDGPDKIGDVFCMVDRLKDQLRCFFQGVDPFHEPPRQNETSKAYWIRKDNDREAQPLAVCTTSSGHSWHDMP